MLKLADLTHQMKNHASAREALERDGFVVLPDVLTPIQVSALREHMQALVNDYEGISAGKRNLLQYGAIRDLVLSPRLRTLMQAMLGDSSFAVRGLFFDKNPDANWKVPYHQDLSIAVRDKVHVESFGPWSVKAGVIHVQPPREYLELMLAARIHLDDCLADNGALRVLPGTHRLGQLNASRIAECRTQIEEAVCELPSGGVLLMRPLLLHASSAAKTPTHRRVIHLEFAAAELPDPLQWYDRI